MGDEVVPLSPIGIVVKAFSSAQFSPDEEIAVSVVEEGFDESISHKLA